MNTTLQKLWRSSSSSRNKQTAADMEIMSCRLQKLNVKELEDGHETFLLRGGGGGMSLVMSTSDDSLAFKKQELPFSAKIAAAMDADGLIGVQEHLSNKTMQKPTSKGVHNPELIVAPLQAATETPAVDGTHLISSCKDASLSVASIRQFNSGASSSLQKRRTGWMTFRKLRRRRTFLGRFWKTYIRRLFPPSTRRQHRRGLLK